MFFIWIGKKGFMRGPIWFLLFCGSIAGVIGSLLKIRDTGNVDIGTIAMLVMSILYIAAYNILPKTVKLPAPPPNVPETNSALSVPAYLTIVRDSSAVGALMPTIITLNGL